MTTGVEVGYGSGPYTRSQPRLSSAVASTAYYGYLLLLLIIITIILNILIQSVVVSTRVNQNFFKFKNNITMIEKYQIGIMLYPLHVKDDN